LLEKAYAKLHSNYINIKNLSFEDILTDFTNCHITEMDLNDPSKVLFYES